MKTYIYTAKDLDENTRKVRVCRIKNNMAQFLFEVIFLKSSYNEKDAIFVTLIANGEIPQSYNKLSFEELGKYCCYCKEVEKKGIRIYGMD